MAIHWNSLFVDFRNKVPMALRRPPRGRIAVERRPV